MEKSSAFVAFGRGPQKASYNHRGFLVVLCAKKNGKKKKKKTNDGEQQQQQQQQQQRDVPPPRRITGKKNGVSVNAQIRLVDRWKKAASSTNEMTSLTGPPERRMRRSESDATTTTTTTRKANANHSNDAYQAELKRRRTLAAEKRKKEREAYLQKMALDANDENLGAFFDASGGGDEGKKTKCFVDGYNVCGVPDEDDARMRVSGKNGSGGGGGGIPHLRRTFLVEGDLDRARKILEEKAKAFAISRNMECVIVWDNNNYHANNSNSNSSNGGFSEKERAEDVGDGVTVVFTGNGQLADGYIERETKLLAEKKDGENVYVVTSDNAVRMAVSSTTARVIDSANFCREIRDTERDEDAILRELALDARWGGGAKKNKASIGASVLGDASAREKMLKLRETARNSSKAEMNEKLVGKSGSFGRFKQNSNRDKSNATTTAANKEEGERTNVAKRLLMRRARADERNRNNNGSDDDESGSYQRWGSL